MSDRHREHAYLRLAVDLVILTVREHQLNALVITRGHGPFEGDYALPGGFLRDDEDLAAAARRELEEETGLRGDDLHLEQLAAYGAVDRDPRGRVVSVAFLALMPDLPIPTAGSDASSARWSPVTRIGGRLAFDHEVILADAVERARVRLETTPLATAFCAPQFTIGDLRQVYEAVWGMQLDPRNFSRKVLNTSGFVEATGDRRLPETGRPAVLYQRGPAPVLHPPLLRTSAAAS